MASRGRHVRGYVGWVRLPAAGPAFVCFPFLSRGGVGELQLGTPTAKRKEKEKKNPKGGTGRCVVARSLAQSTSLAAALRYFCVFFFSALNCGDSLL